MVRKARELPAINFCTVRFCTSVRDIALAIGKNRYTIIPNFRYLLAKNQVTRQLFISIGLCLAVFSQSCAATHRPSTDSVKQHRWWQAAALGYGGAQVGLYAAWYRGQTQRSFHFFDDGAQWQQVDKVGHFYSAFQLSQISHRALRQVGLSPSKSTGYGSLMGWLSLLPTEVFDGFSTAYGFSWYDLAANAAGSALFSGQHALWHGVRIYPKFSFHRTGLAAERPNTLGSNLPEEVLKDYNGQTYWLSVDLHAFLSKQHPRFPRWLNVAVGYGADQMVHARTAANQAAGYAAYREFYIALDIDLHHYRRPPVTFGNKLWNGLLYTLNLVHLPAPALRYRVGQGWRFHPLYF